MLKLSIVVLLLTLSACSSAPTKPMPRTTDKHTVTITWVRTWPSMPDGAHCPQPYVIGSLPGSGGAKGCAQQTGPDTCTIWAVEPAEASDDYRMRILGHEMTHCFLGDFHP